VAVEVDDLEATVDRLAADGSGLVGGVGQYENVWRMAYVRGPEGIIVSGPSGSVDAAGGEPNRLLVRVRTGRSAFVRSARRAHRMPTLPGAATAAS
jgi:hypothetical protein